MQSLLIIPHICVEGANAISGTLYGFPAITHFLGFVHSLSRDLYSKLGIRLGGCGIICHDFQIHAHQTGGGGEYIFSLTRNPLTKEGKTPSFNEEGKLHMEVSLIIECDFTTDDLDFDTNSAAKDKEEFEKMVYNLAITKRLAGGIITNIAPVSFYEIPQNSAIAEQSIRKKLRGLLPGFVLKDRIYIFNEYLQAQPSLSPFEALLDFYTIKSRSGSTDGSELPQGTKIKWERLSKPYSGWIVPIQSGYKAISPLYEKGYVACARDPNIPFRFVEPIYGLGEWVGLHRIFNIESILWRYSNENDLYICSTKNINNKK